MLGAAYLQTELQHQLEVRGLDKDGNKEELANRLLDTLIAQVSSAPVSNGRPASMFVLTHNLDVGMAFIVSSLLLYFAGATPAS